MAIRDEKTGRFVPNRNTWKVKKGDPNIYYCFQGDELLFFTDDERVKEHNWGKIADGYASTRINGECVLAHRFVSEPSCDELVDHIDRNKKNNMRSNLRNTNKSVNAYNSKIRTTNKSGVVGVRFRDDTKRWQAEIRRNYEKISLGCYGTKEEAIAARKAAERILYGDK